MHRLLAVTAALVVVLSFAGPAAAAASSGVAALQVALRAQGHYAAAVDGVDGPLTRAGLAAFQRQAGLPPTGRLGQATRSALGPLGGPLLGRRELGVGAVGWDVSSLEFSLVAYGLRPTEVDGRFTAGTATALTRFQAMRGLPADGIAGAQTFRALAGGVDAAAASTPPVRPTHVVAAGENLTTIAARYGTSPLLLARASGLAYGATIVPGQRLSLPASAQPTSGSVSGAPSRSDVRASIDHWSSVYGVDPRLARATAWMESGFRHDAVSNVGAVGVMQLLPTTWAWIDRDLLATTTSRDYDGNVRAGVRYLRWLLDEFRGNRRLALAAYYQGAQAVRDRGLFDDTKRYVAAILSLHGSV